MKSVIGIDIGGSCLAADERPVIGSRHFTEFIESGQRRSLVNSAIGSREHHQRPAGFLHFLPANAAIMR